MKRIIPQFVFSLLVATMASVAPAYADQHNIPVVGAAYKLDGQNFMVVGSGKAPFEYTATGESLAILIEQTAAAVIVPVKGSLVRIDPSIPMVWIAQEPHNSWMTNNYIKNFGKDKPYVLLEYDRANN